ncbi:hypothetical protein ACHAXT_008066 [Thalassiosira profunda]
MAKFAAADLPSASDIAPACFKFHRPLSKKRKRLDTADIGTPAYNLLLQLLRCQVKHPNISGAGGDAKKCVKAEKAYSACHAAVMGVGSYNGRKHCGEEMESLFACVNS